MEMSKLNCKYIDLDNISRLGPPGCKHPKALYAEIEQGECGHTGPGAQACDWYEENKKPDG